jgi:threonylcarbamoyladenosine tRNA methylthiotransferase MtaB
MSLSRVVSLGCRLNAAESATIEALLDAAGDGDTLVVNTCAVTREAERDSMAAIRRLARANPGRRIVVTGCAAQLDPARFAAIDGVDAVVGNRDKLSAEIWRTRTARVSDVMESQPFVPVDIGLSESRTRAFVEIQQGCDHRCTFCIIPFARGPSRSLPADEAVRRVRRAVESGRREVVLTGVDLTSWGGDLPDRPRLGDLCARILADVPDLARLRLSSVDPAEIDERLFALFADAPRLAPFLHLSVQSGDDLILKRMKRRHDRAGALAVAARIRRVRPEIAIAADLIAGFPTESEAAFANTLALVDEMGLAHAHVFAYSPRAGTPAARMPAVPEDVVRARARRLRAAAEAARAGYLEARIGGCADVLVERSGTEGLDAQGVRVRLASRAPRGALVRARVAARDGACLVAEAA